MNIQMEEKEFLHIPFIHRIDPKRYAPLANLLAERPTLFADVEAFYQRVITFPSPSLIYNKFLPEYQEYYRHLHGSREPHKPAPREFLPACRELFEAYRGYKHFFLEISASLKFNFITNLHEGHKTRQDLARLLEAYNHLIGPKAIYRAVQGSFDPSGFQLKDSPIHFDSAAMGKFFAAQLKESEAEEYDTYDDDSDVILNPELVEGSKDAQLIVYLVTIGPGIDEVSKKLAENGDVYSAFLLNGIGAGAADGVAQDLNNYLNHRYIQDTENYKFRRLSPGYGDWPLSDQRKIFELLHPEEKLGVILNEGDIMIPEKSTSGIMGIKAR